jgi:hypothetical protein
MTLAKQAPQPIQLIRLALIGGVLMFGVVIVFVHAQPNWKPGALPPALGYALMAYSIAAVVIARAMRGRLLRESNLQRRASLLLAGWSAGEAAGLLGAVLFFVTGQAQWYLIGLLAMACVFALLRTGRAA